MLVSVSKSAHFPSFIVEVRKLTLKAELNPPSPGGNMEILFLREPGPRVKVYPHHSTFI